MSLQGVQPEPPKIPDELRIAVENAQNRYTILESEILRLTKLKKTEEAAIGVLITEKNREQELVDGLAADIVRLEATKRDADAAAAKADERKASLEGERDAVAVKLDSMNKDVESLRADLALIRSEITEAKELRNKLFADNEILHNKSSAFIDAVVTLHRQIL